MSQPDQASRLVIDGFEFARDCQERAGTISVANLSRLTEALFCAEGHVRFVVQGDMAKEDERLLHLEIDGSLELTCQRCLGSLEHPLRLRRRLSLVPPGVAWPEEALEDESFDAIQCAHELDVWSLVEEEILLSLPQAPRHERCALPGSSGDPGKTMPFMALAGLRASQK